MPPRGINHTCSIFCRWQSSLAKAAYCVLYSQPCTINLWLRVAAQQNVNSAHTLTAKVTSYCNHQRSGGGGGGGGCSVSVFVSESVPGEMHSPSANSTQRKQQRELFVAPTLERNLCDKLLFWRRCRCLRCWRSAALSPGTLLWVQRGERALLMAPVPVACVQCVLAVCVCTPCVCVCVRELCMWVSSRNTRASNVCVVGRNVHSFVNVFARHKFNNFAYPAPAPAPSACRLLCHCTLYISA